MERVSECSLVMRTAPVREPLVKPMPSPALRLPSTAERRTILLVDDDPETSEVIGVALRADGYRVERCGTGREALNHLRSHTDICVILLDLELPDLDAERFRTTQLRDRSLAWIPLIVMSGAVNAAPDVERMVARGFVKKPMDLDQLRETLHEIACDGTRLRSEERRSPGWRGVAGRNRRGGPG
jgi:CheY-like chemotaxis protein